MTKTFDTKFMKLVLAVALCDLKSVQRILSSKWYQNNAVKIMLKGQNVGLVDVPVTIHNIARCWKIILDICGENKDFLAHFEGCYEKFRDNNISIMELLKQKFINYSDSINCYDFSSCTPYGAKDEKAYNRIRRRLRKCKLRRIDEELALSFAACDLDKFEELIQYGANPWATLDNDECVWDRIATSCTELTKGLLDKVLHHADSINLTQFMEEIISVAVYLSFKQLLQRYVPYESVSKCSPIKTIPRIVYSAGYDIYIGGTDMELSYDPETDKTECKCFSDPEVIIPPKDIKKLLTPESIAEFMRLKPGPPKYYILDGCTYTMKMIDSNGNIKELICSDAQEEHVPHMVFIERFAQTKDKLK